MNSFDRIRLRYIYLGLPMEIKQYILNSQVKNWNG